MNKLLLKKINRYFIFHVIIVCCTSGQLNAQQQLRINDFTIFSGPNGTGTSLIGSSITINNGSVGGRKLVQTTGNATINANVHSGDKVIITNSNVVNGRITAANSSGSTGTILSVGSSTNISGNIDVNGNIIIGGGTVSGTVTLPINKTYTGPVPAGDTVFGTPNLPILPDMPAERVFTPAGTGTITSSQTYIPQEGPFGTISYSGNKTLILKGPGVYVFNSFNWTGNSNKLIFDFDNKPGKYYIYVHGNADFGKLNASISNGGSADRIFIETHGNGVGTSIPGNSFIIANGSSGGGSKWNGTVYASRAGLNIGSGTGSSTLTGAFYSVTSVTLQSGVTINYSPFDFCEPISSNAGPDQTGASTCGLTQVTLAANTPSSGVGEWSIVSGAGGSFGNTASPSSTFSGVAGNTYTLRWTISNPPCSNSFDDVVISFNSNPSVANAGPDQTGLTTCGLTQVTLNAVAPATGIGSWSIANGSPAGGTFTNNLLSNSTFSGTSGNTYRLVWTVASSPCASTTDTVVITFNQNPTISNAGINQQICITSAAALNANQPIVGSGTWSVVSGPSLLSSQFSSTTNRLAQFTPAGGPGTYKLRWTISNSPCLSSISDIDVSFIAATTTAFAGPDQTNALTCGLTTVTLDANSPVAGSGSWSKISGGPGTFGNELSPVSTFSGSAGNTYVLRWTISNSPCTESSDDVTVTFNQNPVNVNAGPDRVLEFTGTTKLKGTTSTGTASSVWSAINGGIIVTNTGLAEITVSSAGTYIYNVTSSSGCSVSDSVNVSSRLRTIKGSELQSVYENYDKSVFPGSDSAFFDFSRIVNPDTIDYITIDIICKIDTQSVINLLTQPQYGLINIIPNGLSKRTVTGDFPILNLPKLDLLESMLNFARPYYRPTTNAGIIISQGDTTIRSHFVRKGYDLDGTGIKIGIISDSYKTITSGTTAALPLQPVTVPPNPVPQTFNTNTEAQDVIAGDLANVKVLLDFPIPKTDEGRAMMQIVNDVAPGAQKYFYTGFFTAGYMAKAIEILKDSGCVTICDDVTYITEPMLKDGILAKTVNRIKQQGVSYFTAAGNFANRSYEKAFNPIDASSKGFAPGIKAHDFGGGDMFQHVKLAPGNYSIVFQWLDDIYSAEESSGTNYDLDIYLTKDTTGAGLIGYNRDNTFGDPIEFIPITIPPGDSVDYNIFIVNHTTTGNPGRIKCVVFKGGIRYMEFNEGNSTIVGQGNATGAITVGAARFNHVPGHPLLPSSLSGITKPQPEAFSSVGGSWVTDTAGVQIQRLKPDFVAADGVNTTVKMGQDYPNEALDGWSNFFGTSAAAPHAAAGAALLMQGRKKFLTHHPENTAPDTLIDLLKATAIEMRPAGLPNGDYDFKSGSGLIDIDAAMRTFASPKPYQIDRELPGDAIPGNSTFILKITGENFSWNTIVLLINEGDTTELIPNSIDSVNGIIFVTIPPFSGNPEIKAYTPPRTSSGDGGYSNSLFFFSADIEVKAASVIKKYGELLPVLDTIITINGKLLQDTALTLSEIGLDGLQITTAANTFSDVGTYVINVTRNFNVSDSTDRDFLRKFNYEFINGTVSVGKMPVKVVPDNLTVKYGQPINNITYKYYDGQNNQITNSSILQKLDSSHKRFKGNNTLAVINGYPGNPPLTTSDLNNMSGVVTYQALKNARKFKVVNDTWVPVTPADSNRLDLQYIVDVSAQSVRNYLNNPGQSNLEPSFPGIHSRAMLGAQKVLSGNGKINLNGLVPVVNGELMKVVNTVSNAFVPLVNGNLVQVVNGAPMQLVNGVLVPVVNGNLVQVVNGDWVQVVNGVLVPVVNGDLVQVVNGELMKLVNGKFEPLVNADLVKLVNGAGGGSLVQMVNGQLQQMVNGVLQPLVNAELVQVVNGVGLQQLVNGQWQPLVNGDLMKLVNGDLMKLVNGDLMHVVNRTLVPVVNSPYDLQFVNGRLEQLVNGNLYPLVNGLHPLVNGAGGLVPLVNSYGADATTNSNTFIIIDSTDITEQNGVLGALFSTNMITGLGAGQQRLVSGALFNSNFEITYGTGIVDILKDTVTLKADTLTRQYGDSNPALTYSVSGFKYGQNLQSSNISGNVVVSTSAVSTSPVGAYPITFGQSDLSSADYHFKYVNGVLHVTNNPCLITHSPFKNFGNTTLLPTSLWLSLTTKVSGQLSASGDFLLFKAGTITFNSISSTPLVNNFLVPDGKIIADASVQAPITQFDSLNNIWITKVPPGFGSTSDIFVTGARINSSNGFVKQGGNTSSTLKGLFYSNKNFSDQWTYAMAAYQPQFWYGAISAPGQVISINGTYRAGTATPIIPNLVQGASGGGGNNYTGSSSSFDNFTACMLTSPRMMQVPVTEIITQNEIPKTEVFTDKIAEPANSITVFPNPATDKLLIRFKPQASGSTSIEMYSIDGSRVFAEFTGSYKPGNMLVKEVNVSGMRQGVYLIKIINGGQIYSKKIIIAN